MHITFLPVLSLSAFLKCILKIKKVISYIFQRKIHSVLDDFFSNLILQVPFIFPRLNSEIIYSENHIFLLGTYEKLMRFHSKSRQNFQFKICILFISYGYQNKKNVAKCCRKFFKTNAQDRHVTQEDCKIAVMGEVNVNISKMQICRKFLNYVIF